MEGGMTRSTLLLTSLFLCVSACSASPDTTSQEADVAPSAVDTSEVAAADTGQADTGQADTGQADPDTSEAPVPAELCVPGGTPQYLPSTASEYVVMCEPELGVPPSMDCSAGVTIPVEVDGVEVNEILPNFACDKPGLQAGGCVPGSTINRVMGQTREGVALPEVTWVHFCRSEDGVSKGIDSVPVWENVFTGAQMIGYNYETGATCFFELNYGPQGPWVGRDADHRATGVLPNHDEPGFDEAFIPGEQCVVWHQNDAFIHNPWIDAAKMPDDPNESARPRLAAHSPFYIVGGSDWDMRTIHIEGNACLSCHRIGMNTDELFRSLGFDANQWMPTHDPGSLAEHYAALLACHEDGPENTPGCDWVVPPGGGCEGGVVGPDYPNAANRAGGFFGDDGKDDDGGKGDDELDACPGGVAPEVGTPCEGDWTVTLCIADGEAWWCEDGVWVGEDDK